MINTKELENKFNLELNILKVYTNLYKFIEFFHFVMR